MSFPTRTSPDSFQKSWTFPPKHIDSELPYENELKSILVDLDSCSRTCLPRADEFEQCKTTCTSSPEYLFSELPFPNDYTTKHVSQYLVINIPTSCIVNAGYLPLFNPSIIYQISRLPSSFKIPKSLRTKTS